MKFALTIKGAIVDGDTGLKILELLNHAQCISKHWKSEQYEFTDISDSDLCISPVNMSHYAEAVLNLDKKED